MIWVLVLSMIYILLTISTKYHGLSDRNLFQVSNTPHTRVAIHEPGTYPNLHRSGLYAEPGKVTEIKIQPLELRRISTPKRPCLSDDLGRSDQLTGRMVRNHRQLLDRLKAKPDNDYAYTYIDLDVTYRYTQDQCLMLQEQFDIIEQCRCMHVANPRPFEPSPLLPYCASGIDNITSLFDNIKCIQTGPHNVSKRPDYEAELCHPKCHHFAYDKSVSVTTWHGQAWKLHWLNRVTKAFNLMINESKEHPRSSKDQWNVTQSQSFADWKEYADKVSNDKLHLDREVDLGLAGNQFLHIMVTRKSDEVVVSREKLELNINVLLSRIGGLCSLTIGLTLAFLIELVEFVYRLWWRRGGQHQSSKVKGNGQRITGSTVNPAVEKRCAWCGI